MPLQKALAQVGVALQTVKGTAIANPQFGHGVTDGNMIEIDIAQEPLDLTSGSRVSAFAERPSMAVPGAQFTSRCFERSMGLWLHGAFGAKGVTGAGPYTHTFTLADTLPYLTYWSTLAGDLKQIKDFKIDELVISWEENEPPSVQVTGMGTVVNFAPTFVPTVDDQRGNYFPTAGGTYKLDVDSATPVTARIKAGEISIKNNVEAIGVSASVVPDDTFQGRHEVSVSLTLIPEDVTDWRTTVTGASGGTTISEVPIYGSLEVQFTNGANSLKFTALRCPFLVGYPEADPAGGAAEVVAEGNALQPLAGGSPLTAVLINGQATY